MILWYESVFLRVLAIVLYLFPAQNGEIPPETERRRIKMTSVACSEDFTGN